MRRGNIIRVALQGDSGKPRPVIVIQSDLILTTTVLVVPFTTTLLLDDDDAMVIAPDRVNGLIEHSRVMLHRLTTARRDKCSPPIGWLAEEIIDEIGARLAVVLGLTAVFQQ